MLFINLHRDSDGVIHYGGDWRPTTSLDDALDSASREDGYVCTLELTDDGQFVKRRDETETVEMIVCERRFDNQDIEDCECGKHVVLPAEPDVGIFQPYLEG